MFVQKDWFLQNNEISFYTDHANMLIADALAATVA